MATSKFGGIPVDDSAEQPKSRFGGIPVDHQFNPAAIKRPIPIGLTQREGLPLDVENVPTFPERHPGVAKYTQPIADVFAKVTKYLPNSESLLGLAVPAEGATAGLAALGKRALGVGAGVAAGFGTHEAAKKLGAPEILADALGMVAGGWLAGRISPEAAAQVEDLYRSKGAGAVRGLLKSWGANRAEEGGFKLKASILRTTKYGGPAKPATGQAGYASAKTGTPAGPGASIKNFKATEEPERVEYSRKNNPAAYLKYGGPKEPSYGKVGYAKPVRKGINRAVEVTPSEAFSLAEEAGKTEGAGGVAANKFASVAIHTTDAENKLNALVKYANASGVPKKELAGYFKKLVAEGDLKSINQIVSDSYEYAVQNKLPHKGRYKQYKNLEDVTKQATDPVSGKSSKTVFLHLIDELERSSGNVPTNTPE
jgi:hypothetical protein